jgi:hypothetical protein
VEEGEAAPVGGLQAPSQIVPAVNGVHGFIFNDLFKDVGRAFPIDRSEHEEPSVEPACKQVAKVDVERLQGVVLPAEAQEIGAHGNQGPGGVRHLVETADQLLPARFGSADQGFVAGFRLPLFIGSSAARRS